jgi:hypothetical protein
MSIGSNVGQTRQPMGELLVVNGGGRYCKVIANGISAFLSIRRLRVID